MGVVGPICCAFCPSIGTDYRRATRSHARDREAADRGDAGGQPAGNGSVSRGFSWQANVSHLAYTARLTVFVDSLFANNQRIDAKFTQLANR